MQIINTLQGTGVVKIESIPDSAQVHIDGEYYGVTPITIKDVEEGSHHYSLSYPGMQEYQGSMFVYHGQACINKVDLYTGIVDSNCPTAFVASNSNVLSSPMSATINRNIGVESSINTRNLGFGLQSLQVPPPVPGYLIVQERSIIWILAGALAAVFLFALIKKS